MLISLYRTPIVTRKRWYLKLIFHCVDIAKVNAWLLYRRHCNQKGLPKKQIKTLKKFISEIASSLSHSGKDPVRAVGRPKRSISPHLIGRKPTVQAPTHDIRYDKIAHWQEYPLDGKRMRCRLCDMTCSVRCSKCKVGLYFSKERNCFREYHY